MPENIILRPTPVFFIKSISEQGYTLSTAVADLIDNSLTAGASRVELLLDSKSLPLKLFIADNGGGMSAGELTESMRFPSADVEEQRSGNDLGRFGLGLKTASFSQSRKFTVISQKFDQEYAGRTWDIEYLKDWTLLVETGDSITSALNAYHQTSKSFHSEDADFKVSTLVVWDNLYKLKKLLQKNEINDELEDLRSHLGLVFHRFLQSNRLQIRLNNSLIEAFEPFPDKIPGVTPVSEHFWKTEDSYVRFQGIILPKRSAAEAKDSASVWVPAGKTMEELQGLYVYRNERLINYGGWLRAIPKSIALQFGRIRIDISNINDSEFHLNVAKSSLKIPFGLKRAMTEMVIYVAGQAAKEYRERLASSVIRSTSTAKGMALVTKETGAAGPVLKINKDFELYRKLTTTLESSQNELLGSLIGLLENKINEVWKGDNNTAEFVEGLSLAAQDKILKIRHYYEEADYSWDEIRNFLLDSFGRSKETQAFIETLKIK
jgi:hypothetical protein